MRQQLTAFDIYDIFYFPKDGDLCQFHKLNLTKEEFLRGEFLGGNAMSLKKCLIYFYMPSNDELTMGELVNLLEKLGLSSTPEESIWGCSSDGEISHYEVFLMKIY